MCPAHRRNQKQNKQLVCPASQTNKRSHLDPTNDKRHLIQTQHHCNSIGSGAFVAPFGQDLCTINLSDQSTLWNTIKRRVQATVWRDFVIDWLLQSSRQET